jgi:hypothetical protein
MSKKQKQWLPNMKVFEAEIAPDDTLVVNFNFHPKMDKEAQTEFWAITMAHVIVHLTRALKQKYGSADEQEVVGMILKEIKDTKARTSSYGGFIVDRPGGGTN